MSRLHADGLGSPIGAAPAAIPTAYTPATTWPNQVLNGITTAVYLKAAGQLTVWGNFATTSSAGAGILTIPLPAGYTVNFSPGGANPTAMGILATTDGVIRAILSATTGATGVTWLTGSAVGAATYTFQLTVPISG